MTTIRTQAARAAASLLALHLIVAPPVDVGRIAEDLGLEVYVYPLPPHVSGVLSCVDGTFCVGLQSRDSAVKRRFTLAHEIGHYIFDARSNSASFLSQAHPGCSWKERRADLFAAHLLMPPELVKVRQYLGVRKLAQMFEVSHTAMQIQLNSIRKGRV